MLRRAPALNCIFFKVIAPFGSVMMAINQVFFPQCGFATMYVFPWNTSEGHTVL